MRVVSLLGYSFYLFRKKRARERYVVFTCIFKAAFIVKFIFLSLFGLSAKYFILWLVRKDFE